MGPTLWRLLSNELQRKSHLIRTLHHTFQFPPSSPPHSLQLHQSPNAQASAIPNSKPSSSTKPNFVWSALVSCLLSFHLKQKKMAAMNTSVISCNYALSGASDANRKVACAPSVAPVSVASPKLPVIRAQQVHVNAKEGKAIEGRRAALLALAATVFTTAASASQANAGALEDALERSKANKELNDKKRLATSGANLARAYTVEFGSCKFPENFTGCQDLAKQQKVKFLSDDLEIECEGKGQQECASNVFWKW